MTVAKLCYLISLLLADNVYKEYMACFFPCFLGLLTMG